MSTRHDNARAISWAELKAGRWTADYTDRPCTDGLLAVGHRWPEWRTGTPPTWAEFVDAEEIAIDDRRWLVARVLLRDRRRLVAWAVDCAESVAHHAGRWEVEIRAEVIAPLRAWIAGDDTIDLQAVRSRAWALYDTATDYAARAAAYAAYADYADYAADYYASSAAAYDAASIRLALPHLAAVMEVTP